MSEALKRAVRSVGRAALLSTLNSLPGKKVVVLDSLLAGPLGCVLEVTDLKDAGVGTWFELVPAPIPLDDAAPSLVVISGPQPRHLLPFIRAQFLKSTRPPHVIALLGLPDFDSSIRFQLIKFLREQNVDVFSRVEDLISRSGTNRAAVIISCPVRAFPLETDLISLELRGFHASFHAEGRVEVAAAAAHGLDELLQLLGGDRRCNIRAIGSASKWVTEVLLRMRAARMAGGVETQCRELYTRLVRNALDQETENRVDPGVARDKSSKTEKLGEETLGMMVLIDRRVDLMSPFCSQFTYMGLLDSFFGVPDCANVEVPVSVLRPDISNNATETVHPDTEEGWVASSLRRLGVLQSDPARNASQEETAKLPLNSKDPLFLELRDKHHSSLGPFLHIRASEIQKTYKAKDDLKTIAEINSFMRELRAKQSEHSSLVAHVNLATHISAVMKESDFKTLLRLEDDILGVSGGSPPALLVNQLEDLIDSTTEPFEAYRLVVLLSIVAEGIKSKILDQLKWAFLQSHGIGELMRLKAFEEGGLLQHFTGKGSWETIKREFRLVVEGGSKQEEQSEDSIAYPYSGYAPLTVRLVQRLFSPGGWRACAELLDGLWGPAVEITQDSKDGNWQETGGTVVLIVFLGGVTYGEIAAVRKLQERDLERRYIVVTTEVINSRRFLESFTR